MSECLTRKSSRGRMCRMSLTAMWTVKISVHFFARFFHQNNTLRCTYLCREMNDQCEDVCIELCDIRFEKYDDRSVNLIGFCHIMPEFANFCRERYENERVRFYQDIQKLREDFAKAHFLDLAIHF